MAGRVCAAGPSASSQASAPFARLNGAHLFLEAEMRPGTTEKGSAIRETTGARTV
jgi:hypothetical protein